MGWAIQWRVNLNFLKKASWKWIIPSIMMGQSRVENLVGKQKLDSIEIDGFGILNFWKDGNKRAKLEMMKINVIGSSDLMVETLEQSFAPSQQGSTTAKRQADRTQ